MFPVTLTCPVTKVLPDTLKILAVALEASTLPAAVTLPLRISALAFLGRTVTTLLIKVPFPRKKEFVDMVPVTFAFVPVRFPCTSVLIVDGKGPLLIPVICEPSPKKNPVVIFPETSTKFPMRFPLISLLLTAGKPV
ncbi:hypothetical protein FR483_n068L [Paramecium bursaria Chlorella virus FR483]|uniref:Uncharacterized protein n068L n=1 Tax=Paramecium bursaria Chlorella virus FR483 TaxID=399781 RepID=A7J6C2_PBCVF|nr:hypothetical protein FR483_n068L [Paramecium bursaria Chlorella virus FR483]ABT15353.1 hypothetical protein FR483_n068L [Paramecium bursaria Chlorella virus FR483]